MTGNLFASEAPDTPPAPQLLADGVVLLAGFALARADELLAQVRVVTAQAPWRHMVTPGGRRMAVALTGCGPLGWVSDTRGYRYSPLDPDTGHPWPPMPPVFQALARDAAEQAGFPGFVPDACLINRYRPGDRLTLHQDRNERDFSAPIVSVSLGLSAVFLLGGLRRADPTHRLGLNHGDVLVWGGAGRLRFHGVLPVVAGRHPATDDGRINLTFRKAG
jgi:alkylated DNA repair protein (DNA oxidative demethylase)